MAALDPAANGIHCLIVDGNEGLQRLVHAWLVSLKVEHTQVYDGQHAVGACSQFDYGLIFMDLDSEWAQPVPNGLVAASNIRLQGRNTQVPIVAWTGQDDAHALPWRDAGCNDVLSKPFNKDDLIRVLNSFASSFEASSMAPIDFSGVNLLDVATLDAPSFLTPELAVPKSARVLVVEDCSLTQHVICTLLKELTNSVTQAFDGEQGLQMCQSQGFDIIFMDIHMPKLGGLQATYTIRNSSNLNLYTPIIAFTSSGTLDEYQQYGVNDLLSKPFTVESLSKIFDKWTPYTQSPASPASAAVSSPLGVSGHSRAASDGLLGLPDSGAVGRRGSHENLMNIGLRPQQAGLAMSPSSPLAGRRGRSDSNPQSYMGQLADSIAMGGVPTRSAASDPYQKSGRTGAWPKKKKVNAIGHTAKEKMRRASIVNSCNLFRTLVPGVKDTDKANVFRLSVDYMAFLRSQFKDEDLAALDQKFCEQVQIKHLSDQSASLSITPVEAGTASASNSRPNSPQVTQQQAAASPSASVPLSASPSDFTQGSPVSFSPQQSPAQQLGMA